MRFQACQALPRSQVQNVDLVIVQTRCRLVFTGEEPAIGTDGRTRYPPFLLPGWKIEYLNHRFGFQVKYLALARMVGEGYYENTVGQGQTFPGPRQSDHVHLLPVPVGPVLPG